MLYWGFDFFMTMYVTKYTEITDSKTVCLFEIAYKKECIEAAIIFLDTIKGA